MLKPLEQWYCDVCGEVVDHVKEGYVLFSHTKEELKYDNFRIIHKVKCDNDKLASSAALEDFVGVNGITRLTSFMSLGPLKTNLGSRPYTQVRDMENFTDFF